MLSSPDLCEEARCIVVVSGGRRQTVKEWFGFITPDDGGKDLFVHISDVERSGLSTLPDGQKVSFVSQPDTRSKGPKAVDLRAM